MTTPQDMALINEIRASWEKYGVNQREMDMLSAALRGRARADWTVSQLSAHRFGAIPEPIVDVLFKQQPQKIALAELDRRALDLLMALNQVDVAYRFLADNPLIADIIAVTLQRWGNVTELFRTVLLRNLRLTKDGRATQIGLAMLPHFVVHPQEGLAVVTQARSWNSAALNVIQLLLTAQPPELDLADDYAALDGEDAGKCAALLLKVDATRFLKHALRLTEPDFNANRTARVDALQALMALDPQIYASRAAAAAEEPIQPNASGRMQQVGLELAFRTDPGRYLPLLVAAIANPNESMAIYAAKLAAEAPAEAVLPELRLAMNREEVDVVLAALETLLALGSLDDALQALTHPSKKVRDRAVTWLVAHPDEAAPRMGAFVEHRTSNVRLAAVAVLAGFANAPSHEILRARLEKETAKLVKQAIMDALGIQSPDATPVAPAVGSVAGVIAAAEVEARKLGARVEHAPVAWITVDSPLPPLRWADGMPVSELLVNYILVMQSRAKDFQLAPPVAALAALLDRPSAAAFSAALLQGWVAQGANTKEIWCLAFVAAFGGDPVAWMLQRQIDDWVKHARGALAARAVWAIPLIGTDLALSSLNDIAARVKHKQVKQAAHQAFAAAAQALGVTQDDLQDRVAPRLGLDERGERTFDYGPRQFVVRLLPDLTVTACDASGKTIKQMPAPNKSDDAEKAAQAQQVWKDLRAALKQVARGQAARLEQALVGRRAWTLDGWTAVILRHPVLRVMAVPLVWEAAVPGAEAPVLFRPLEDGSLTDVHDDPVTLPAGAQISLAHPVTLDEATRAEWLQHLSDYDLKPPFAQLARKIAVVSDPKARIWNGCEGYVVEALALMGRFDKAGWQRGSVQDGGGYHNIWKDFPAAGIEAVLNFSGMAVGYTDTGAVVLYSLQFARAGSIKRGSYVYDDLKEDDKRALKLGDAGAIVYSEAVGDVQSFMAAGAFDPNWRTRK